MASSRSHPTLGERIRWAGWTSWMLIGLLALAYLAFMFVIRPISVVFVPLTIALAITYLLHALVTRLERRGVRRGIGVLVIYTLFLLVLIIVGSRLFPLIGRQVSALLADLPNLVQKGVDEINQFAARRGLDARINLTSDQILASINANRENIIGFLGGVRSIAGQIIGVITTVVIGLVLSIYFLLDLPKIQRGFSRAIPPDYRDETLEVFDRVGAAVGAFFRGQLLVATFVGVATALGLTLIGLRFGVVIGLLAGIFNLIPLIGPFLAAIPAVIVALLQHSPAMALKAMLVLLVVQQIDNHFISPRIIGRTVQMHPITVMLGLLAGATIAGIFGMIIVIPTIAALKIVASHLWSKREHLGVPDAIADAGEA